MAVDAIAQPRSGENLKALGPARNNHPSPPPSVRFLSEGIGKEATDLMQNGFSSSGWVRCASRWSGASAVSRLLPHRLRWSKLQPPREWRNGRRAGLRIRCPKGRGSSTLPSRTLLTCGSSFRRHSPTAPTCPSCSRLFTEGHEPNQPSRRTGSVDLCRQLRDVGGSRARRGHDHGKTPASRCTT
jgi:hypothetical protein